MYLIYNLHEQFVFVKLFNFFFIVEQNKYIKQFTFKFQVG